jgi:ATP-dependent RNA helicase RhlE
MSFQKLNLSEPLVKALEAKGYVNPTPIQSQAIPEILNGRDLLGTAQTGTGKTAAFCLPIIEKLKGQTPTKGIKALVLAPTRELALQVDESLTQYSKFANIRHAVIFGGVNQNPQVQKLRQGVEVVVATPGRLLDLMNQGFVDLSKLQMLVLDEADRMLDMGFINDIRKIIARTPSTRQTIFFSATMPDEIKDLVASILKNPVRVAVAPVSSTAEAIQQSVYFVDRTQKRALLQHVIREKEMENVLVFTRTKRGADRVAQDLNKAGIMAEAIHGNKSQGARQKALSNFKKRTTRVLVATDIAARGIDVVDLPFVINFELPETPETYVHRIGRTGRAGALGVALSFCDSEERGYLKDIHKVSKAAIAVVESHPYLSVVSEQRVSPALASVNKKRRFDSFNRRSSKTYSR